MPSLAYIKTDCEHCGGHIEFPSELAGQSIQCPHCQQTTTLPSPFGPPPPLPPVPAALPHYTGRPVLPPSQPRAKSSNAILVGLLVCAVFVLFIVIALMLSNGGTSPTATEPARKDYTSLTYQNSYFDVVRKLGQPDRETEARDVPMPNVVLGYEREKWIVYVLYSDRSFDKTKSRYLGIISTQGTVIHAADDKSRTILDALAYGIRNANR